MRSDMVVMVSPVADLSPGILKACEPMKVAAVVPELAVEAFHERVLRWLPRLDEMELDPSALCPEEHGLAGQFWAVVPAE